MAEVGLPIWQPGVWADTVWADGVWRDPFDIIEQWTWRASYAIYHQRSGG